MKTFLSVLFILMVSQLAAQTDSVPGGVYSWNKARPEKTAFGERRKILQGSSLDLSRLEVHTVMLNAGQSASGAEVKMDLEKLIIVKDGQLAITIKDSSKTLGPGSYAVIIAGDKHGFKNTSGKPVVYFSLSYTAKLPVNIQRGNIAGGSFMKDWSQLEVRQTNKGESRPIFDRPSSMFAKFDMHATALNPGIASHDAHTHRAEEIILMIKGDVQFQLNQSFAPASPGDVIFYPAYSLHAVKNTGSLQCGYFAIQWRN
ncbi:MAG: cupin domain-containing protein [Chitinophagaceae bacterium]